MGLGPTLILLNFESDLDHGLDTKKKKKFQIFPFADYCLCRGMHSPSALVGILKLTPLVSNFDRYLFTFLETTVVVRECCMAVKMV